MDFLIEKAIQAQKQALAIRSGYKVGAAILDIRQQVFQGFNIEFYTQTSTIHAECAAVMNALLHGTQKPEIIALAVVVSDKKPWFPCGICRQVLSECNNNMKIIACNNTKEKIETKTALLHEIFPDAFTRE